MNIVKSLNSSKEYPLEGYPLSSTWKTTNGYNHWTTGFFPGVLWYLYHYTGDQKWKGLAISWTDGLYDDQFLTVTHDLGFIILCSYGNGYTFTKNESYPKIIATAASSLAKRYNPIVGCIRSWNIDPDHGGYNGEFTVIVDSMMNMELFFEGWKITGNKTYYDIAVSHANHTLKEHIRADGSSYHNVAFNETDGKVIRKYSAQGYADWSCWSRGQSWLISGFTMLYRYTKMNHYLDAAERVAKYYIDHLPEDFVPFWDFNVPRDFSHQYIPRDTSSAAAAASGLLELYQYTHNETYLNTSNKIMDSLSSPKYRADGNPQYKLPALLVNGTAFYNRNDFDTSLAYGDYFFMKALGHYLKSK